jgi:dynein heavy chain
MTVMCAVCAILQHKSDWTTAKQLVADPGFINKLIHFDKHTLNDKIYSKIKQFSKNPDFTPAIVGKVSIACQSLCNWVLAIESYYEVYRRIKPKEEKVKEANYALDVMRAGLKRKEDMLAEVF